MIVRALSRCNAETCPFLSLLHRIVEVWTKRKRHESASARSIRQTCYPVRVQPMMP